MKCSAAAGKLQTDRSEIAALLDLSSRIGRDPLLVQASSGNTSVKIDGTLWVKASGKWLVHAGREEFLVPVQLSECIDRLERREDSPLQLESSRANRLRPSTETFMHAVLPHRVVIHVHSVNTIAWAVRQDAAVQLKERLYGLRWRWIPYMASRLQLARRMRGACRRGPKPEVFILGNRGLVVCGEDCERVEYLLFEVERRLAIPPRIVPQPNYRALEQVACISGWRLPHEAAIHTLGTDGHSRRIAQGGILYPSQAIFLGPGIPQLPRDDVPSGMRRRIARIRELSPFLVVERSGVLESDSILAEEEATLRGYVEVVRRIDTCASIRYLSNQEVKAVSDGTSNACAAGN
jgi:rhamnose utilization protein RhaD (predicted bifunctional aldolase and dehydrogenase)